MLNAEELEKLRLAGNIARKAMDFAIKNLKTGVSILAFCQAVDQKIFDLGAIPAWPTQVAINEVAAHYTPSFDEKSTFKESIVSIDLGVCIDGIIADMATSVNLSKEQEFQKLVNAAEKALAAAIKIIEPGIAISEIGATVESIAEKEGFKTIRNLFGHGIDKWTIHKKPTIPSFKSDQSDKLNPGQIIAIEPFITNGVAGLVEERGKCEIFALTEKRPTRNIWTNQVQSWIFETRRNLPFALRWCIEKFGEAKTGIAIKELLDLGVLHKHPPLVERSNGLVAVFEKTLYLHEDKIEVIT